MARNTKAYVIDASFISSFLLPDEKNPLVEDVFNDVATKKSRLISTPLLDFEVINCVRTTVLRKRISKDLALRLIEEYFNIEIDIKPVNMKKAFHVSVEKNLTFYDSSYLTLSEELNISLLSLDKKLVTVHGSNIKLSF